MDSFREFKFKIRVKKVTYYISYRNPLSHEEYNRMVCKQNWIVGKMIAGLLFEH